MTSYSNTDSKNENSISKILRYSGLNVWEIDCEKSKIRILSHSARPVQNSRQIDYERYLHRFLNKFVHERSHKELLARGSISYMAELFENGSDEITLDIKRSDEGAIESDWLRIVVVPGTLENGILKTAIVLVKNICMNMPRNSSSSMQLSGHFNAAIRNTYCTTFDINYTYNTYYITSYSGLFDCDLPERGIYSDGVKFIAKTVIHPDDRMRFLSDIDSSNVLSKLNASDKSTYGEYRIMCTDGIYRWISVRIVEIESADKDDCRNAVAFIRNIHAQKLEQFEQERENRRYNLALRESYEGIYELDLSTATVKVIQANDGVVGKSYDYSDAYRNAVENVFLSDDCAMYEKLKLANLKNTFEIKKEDYIFIECRYRYKKAAPHWVSIRIVPVPDEDKNIKLLFLLRNVENQKADEKKHIQKEKQYNAALRESFDIICSTNLETGIYEPVHFSLAASKVEMKAIHHDEIIEFTANEFLHPDDRKKYIACMKLDNLRKTLLENGEFNIEYRCLNENHEYAWFSANIKLVENENDNSQYAFSFIKNIDENKKSEDLAVRYKMLEQEIQHQKELNISDSRYKIIVQQTGTAVFEWNRDEDTVYVSDMLPAYFKDNFIKNKSLTNILPLEYIHNDDHPACEAFTEALEKNSPQAEVVCRIMNNDGKFVWYRISVTIMYNEQCEPERIVGTVLDINEQKNTYETLLYRAEYDSLTGAPNMQKFYADGKALLENTDDKYAIIRLDIDKFKIINDIYGNAEGDNIIRHIAEILRTLSDKKNIYARLNGDVFGFMARYDTDDDLVALVNKISAGILEYTIEHNIKMSFGICKIEDRTTPISTLCDWANLASKKIKGSMLFNYAFYDETLRNEILEEKNIEDEMHGALNQNQFKLFLQPKYNIETATIIGAESLVRWMHPEKGLIPPGVFISLFEKNGFIVELDQYIWEQTCKLLKKWIDMGLTPMPISINISRMHINNPKFSDTLINLVEKYDVPPRLLELELTESAFLDDMGGLIDSLKKLQTAGFSLAMDDFGAGYSSLNMLKNMPIDIIKIDREFLNETVVTEKGKTVIRYTIAMAKQLDMNVIAEGVETIDQAAFLLESGCSIAQGFYYSKPVCIEEFEELAFHRNEEKDIEPEINDVLSKNQDLVSIMLSLDKTSENIDLFKSNTISANELADLKRAFVSVINKYRLAIQKSNISLFEVDFKTNTVLGTLRADSFMKDQKFKTLENIRDYTIEHGKCEYKDIITELFDVNYIVDKVVKQHQDISAEFEMVMDGKNLWTELNVIPIITDKQLERLLLSFTNITSIKEREQYLEECLDESRNMLDMTEDMFYIWNLSDNSLKLSHKAKEFFDEREIKSTLTDTVVQTANLSAETKSMLHEHISRVHSGEDANEFEKLICTNSGEKYEIKSRRIVGNDGRLNKTIGIIKKR